MAKNYEVQSVNQSVLVSITCDRCRKTVDNNNGAIRGGEIMTQFGYGSKFDSMRGSEGSGEDFDICDDCAEDFFEQWIKFGRTEETE